MSSIKWKMAVLYMLLVVVVMTSQGVLILLNLRANAYQEVYRKSEYTADRIIDMLSMQELDRSVRVETIFGEVLTSLMIETVNTDSLSGSETSVYLLSDQGKLLYARKSNLSEADLASRAIITVVSGGKLDNLYVHTSVTGKSSVGDYAVGFDMPESDTSYILFIRQSMEDVQENLRRTTLIIVLVTMVGIIVAGFLGYLLAVSISSPILKLTQKTQALAEGTRAESIRSENGIPSEKAEDEHHAATMPSGEEKLIETSPISGDELDILEVNFDDMAKELTESIRDLKAMEQMQKDFVANVSHELRTPVTTIKSYSETLLDSDLEETNLTREFLSVIAHEANRMTALIADLLELSKMDAHQVKAAGKPIEVGRLLRQDLIDLTWDARQKQQEIRWSEEMDLVEEEVGEFPWPREEYWILGESRRIDQVIRNLLTNAIKYSPEGSVIRGGITLSEGEVCVWIRDEGIGIAREHQEKIFNRFYRVDKARSRSMGGTGLGLAIAKETTELYGGRIYLDSHPGEGSTFYLAFPEAPEVDKDAD